VTGCFFALGSRLLSKTIYRLVPRSSSLPLGRYLVPIRLVPIFYDSPIIPENPLRRKTRHI